MSRATLVVSEVLPSACRKADNKCIDRRMGLLCLAVSTFVACSHTAPPQDGYKRGAVPSISQTEARRILGTPSQSGPVSLPGARSTEVMTYSFGQLLLQQGRVVAVTVANDKQYVGPYGIALGMSEDHVKAAFLTHRKKRTGHRSSYDVVAGTMDTRSRDLYDDTDGLIVEMAAANSNDPEAPFYVVSVTLVNAAGSKLMSAMTRSKLSGLNSGQHVYNFVDEPWSTR